MKWKIQEKSSSGASKGFRNLLSTGIAFCEDLNFNRQGICNTCPVWEEYNLEKQKQSFIIATKDKFKAKVVLKIFQVFKNSRSLISPLVLYAFGIQNLMQ